MPIDPAAPPPMTRDGAVAGQLAELERRLSALERGLLGGGGAVRLVDQRPRLDAGEPAIGTPVGGGYLYVLDGALRYRGSSGTTTTIAPA